MKKTKSLFFIVVGAFAVFGGLAELTAVHSSASRAHKMRPQSAVLGANLTSDYKLADGLFCGVMNADLHFDIECPSIVDTADSFIVRSKLSINNISFEHSCWRLSDDDKMKLALEPIKSGRIGFALSIAGLETRPKDVAFASDGQVQWSAMAQKTGTLEGFIVAVPDSDIYVLPLRNDILVSYQIHSNPKQIITIKVVEDLFSREKLFSYVVTFLGTLLTLPGILSFLRDRQKAKEERREKEAQKEREAEKRLIIEP